ncbi:Naphthalene 1,2-dioxygenase system, ferredoxin component (plasmid) [Caballeronia sp. SBC1]|jgi:nitrite reductase/ring-hydroxylating ferredoxin subunit|uniref:non-heme iron oxygenase ferredoxin subunit n=1 Tax=unclassified Caballeronia TaxID=2646786 RepID=UPI0013E113CD|nr:MULTISPECIES: non-heme iron oxygenase ferredoxin subunit [unclassified Caballeronia]QIE27293.1 Naphthalene 1,2-dioxygenase system, ferredoxin component [Caballeronia sp. SBC2]QIN65226.1 Naphthalene 1,2-dioxygenase system, ferredoxin component [Caballeronia sp. SBC1]
MTLKFAANLDDLSADEPYATTIENEQIALYLVDGEVYATHNVCTHQFALLSDGFLEDGCIECPLHQGKFDVRTGAALCAPTTAPIRTYKIQIEKGAVMVEL